MTHEVDRWDAEEWLQEHKDIWNHPMVRDRTETNGYEVADLMAEFANYILDKQKQKTKDMTKTAVEWFAEKVEQHLLTFGSIQPNVLSKFKQQAKEMDKQQKMDAYNQGYRDGEVDAHNPTNISKDISEFSNAENYIKETYGGNK